MVLGFIKGFTFQVVRLLTFLIALVVAKRYAGSTEPGDDSGFASYLMSWFPNQFDNKQIAVYMAFFLIFVAIFILGTLLGFLLRSLLKRLELRSFDRLLGGLLGIVVGAICIVVIVSIIVSVYPNSELVDKMRQSHTLRLSTKVIKHSSPFFPEALREKINEVIEKLPVHEEKADNQEKPSDD